MRGQGVSLDIDIDLIGAIIDDSWPWFEAWLLTLALVLGIAVLLTARDIVRAWRSPVRRMMRRH
ncbi:hypothetical protein ACRQ5Q_22510 [Bradyrhizobium sp. PMVTL-01]|uniref:hypothetical protein n=1 Tax=Bradyrhizobium sp. PMVTL-01 TaxID=3434999 RepID=UPI003F7004DF